MKYITIIVAALLASNISVADEYETKSQYTKSYKCVVDEMGGYNHTATEHQLSRFKGEDVFYLTHITHISVRVMLATMKFPYYRKQAEALKIKHPDWSNESLARQVVEQMKLEQSKGILGKDRYYETGSYVISTNEDNPLDWATYRESCKAVSIPDLKSSNIVCYASSTVEYVDEVFNFDVTTGRFAYMYLGSWHIDNKMEDYFGDSSLFKYGKCKEYYRY